MFYLAKKIKPQKKLDTNQVWPIGPHGLFNLGHEYYLIVFNWSIGFTNEKSYTSITITSIIVTVSWSLPCCFFLVNHACHVTLTRAHVSSPMFVTMFLSRRPHSLIPLVGLHGLWNVILF
jgi:hypothetical protein